MIKFLIRLFRAGNGFVLLLFYTKRFSPSIFEGKRVALVGPADSAFHTGKGSYIDGFDVVVRINKAPWLLKTGKWENDIGKKVNILFHSFYENDFSGGGKLDFELYRELGIQCVVNPIPTFAGWRVSFNFYKKYLRREVVYTLPMALYKDIKRRLKTYEPTTGLCALKCIMDSDFSELYITGFTFFKTGYGEGYRDAMKEADKANQYISKMKIHNPDLEFTEFLNLLGKNKHKNITLDDTLQKIVSNG